MDVKEARGLICTAGEKEGMDSRTSEAPATVCRIIHLAYRTPTRQSICEVESRTLHTQGAPAAVNRTDPDGQHAALRQSAAMLLLVPVALPSVGLDVRVAANWRRSVSKQSSRGTFSSLSSNVTTFAALSTPSKKSEQTVRQNRRKKQTSITQKVPTLLAVTTQALTVANSSGHFLTESHTNNDSGMRVHPIPMSPSMTGAPAIFPTSPSMSPISENVGPTASAPAAANGAPFCHRLRETFRSSAHSSNDISSHMR